MTDDRIVEGLAAEVERMRAERDRLRAMLSRVPVVSPCETSPPPPRCGACSACRELMALDDEVERWDRETTR